MATLKVLLFKGGVGAGPRVEQSELKHGGGGGGAGPHTRFTAEVLLFKGGAGAGSPYTRQCIHKVVHTEGDLWPPHESCYLRGAAAGPRVERSELKQWGLAVHTQGGAHRR